MNQYVMKNKVDIYFASVFGHFKGGKKALFPFILLALCPVWRGINYGMRSLCSSDTIEMNVVT